MIFCIWYKESNFGAWRKSSCSMMDKKAAEKQADNLKTQEDWFKVCVVPDGEYPIKEDDSVLGYGSAAESKSLEVDNKLFIKGATIVNKVSQLLEEVNVCLSFNKLKEGANETRFRASIYVDIFVESMGDLEKEREEARKQVEEFADKIPNSYVGDVAYYTPSNLMNPFDKEI